MVKLAAKRSEGVKITIFDGRRYWYKAKLIELSCSDSSDGSMPPKDDKIEYELKSYSATIRHRLLSIRNIQRLVSSRIDCFKGQVLVKDIRGEYAMIDIYVKRFGIALIPNTLNSLFDEVQHLMIERMMREQIPPEHYDKIDEIFESVLVVINK